ncbi:MAG: hypothetical protein WAP51_02665 [Candidatus Sungiibacteriota bacterium]
MRFTLAIIIFLVSLFLEIVFVPRGLGTFLPVSLWFAAMAFVVLEPREVVLFALAAGFLKALFLPALGGFFPMLFLASALAVLSVRRFLGGAGFISDFAALAVAVFSFEFLGLLLLGFSGFSGPDAFTISGAYFTAALPQEFLMNAVFLLLAGLAFYLYERRHSTRRALYV